MRTNPDGVFVLVKTLQELGVDLPAEVTATASQIMRLPSLRPRPEQPAQLLGHSDEQLSRMITQLGMEFALTDGGGPGDRATDTMRIWLSGALTEAVRDVAEDVLTQLRPAFTAAAKKVHAAAKLGINPGTKDRDILKADNIAAVRDAWTSVPPSTRTLDAIAAARIDLSVVTGLPPAPDLGPWSGPPLPLSEWASSAFRKDAPPWRGEFEQTWQMWLRLSAARPVELLPITKTEHMANA